MLPTFELSATETQWTAWVQALGLSLPTRKSISSPRELSTNLVLRQDDVSGTTTFSWLREINGSFPDGDTLGRDGEAGAFLHSEAFERRRCLVPVTTLHIVRNNSRCCLSLATGEVFSIGAVWHRSSHGRHLSGHCFSLLTVPPNPLMASLFNRMPLLISAIDQSTWLDHSSGTSLPGHLVRPLSALQLKAWQLSPFASRA